LNCNVVVVVVVVEFVLIYVCDTYVLHYSKS